jgi:hypothetical protein
MLVITGAHFEGGTDKGRESCIVPGVRERREIPSLREPTRSLERTRRKGVGSLRSE